MTDSFNPSVFLKQMKQADKDEKHSDHVKKRIDGRKEFYARARINEEKVRILTEALLRSAVIDRSGNIVAKWDLELLDVLFADIQDPGPIHEKYGKKKDN